MVAMSKSAPIEVTAPVCAASLTLFPRPTKMERVRLIREFYGSVITEYLLRGRTRELNPARVRLRAGSTGCRSGRRRSGQ